MSGWREWRERRAVLDVFAVSSVGLANEGIRSAPSYCVGPRMRHIASDAAIEAGVTATRCLVCRTHIELLDGDWRAVSSA